MGSEMCIRDRSSAFFFAQVSSRRKMARPPITKTRPSYVTHLEEILPYGEESDMACDFEHEYLPFALAELRLPSCATLSTAAAES